uniref:carnosine N-methyltransferase n=1 Tax=Plectus sambesii TaxID=2011161 RepID=A0A914XBA0_9BILA
MDQVVDSKGENGEQSNDAEDAVTSQSYTHANGCSHPQSESAEKSSLDDKDCGSSARKHMDDEAITFETILNAFRFYKKHSLFKLKHAYDMFCQMPERQRKLLMPQYLNHLAKLKDCITHNHSMLRAIVANVGHMFENRDHQTEVEVTQLRAASEFHMDKLRSTLRQIVRDWSIDGAVERESCNEPVIAAVLERYPDVNARKDIQILVPGAGLGRLAWDFARLGFSCQGNEFSLFMLFVSNFILNRCVEVDQFTIYPWIHDSCNNWSYGDQVRPVRFPDVNPCDLPKTGNSFSMSAGDFIEVFANEREQFDCVATVFFLDTAHNIIDYIETIHRILKPGGFWVNLGPLLYHFADSTEMNSIELPYEEVRQLVVASGFRIDKEQQGLPACYTLNSRSMLQYRYNCAFFACTKLPSESDGTV